MRKSLHRRRRSKTHAGFRREIPLQNPALLQRNFEAQSIIQLLTKFKRTTLSNIFLITTFAHGTNRLYFTHLHRRCIVAYWWRRINTFHTHFSLSIFFGCDHRIVVLVIYSRHNESYWSMAKTKGAPIGYARGFNIRLMFSCSYIQYSGMDYSPHPRNTVPW
jgi:hypothetical protein